MGAYFDNAATTYPKPESVYGFMDRFYRENGGNAGRGQYKLAASASKLIAETRSALQKVLLCENKEVIFAPSATIAMNMVLQGIITAENPNIYISPFEHNAVTRTLHALTEKYDLKVNILPINSEFQYDLVKTKAMFHQHNPDVLVVSHASNVCGLIAPVTELAALAKEYDCIVVVDVAQTAGLVPLHAGSDDIDYIVFAGHKTLYGPIGVGGFIKKQICSPMPVLYGGTGVESASQEMPRGVPGRYEMGSQNIHAIAGLHAALYWFWDHANDIRRVEAEHHAHLCQLLHKYPNIQIIGPQDRHNCIGVVSCVFDHYSSDNIGDVLDRLGIAVRTGLHCAPIAHQTLRTFPAGTVRFSVGYFTSENDFCALDEALDYIAANG